MVYRDGNGVTPVFREFFWNKNNSSKQMKIMIKRDCIEKFNIFDRMVKNLNWFKSITLKYEDENSIFIRVCGITDGAVIFAESDHKKAYRFVLKSEDIVYIADFFIHEVGKSDPSIFWYHIKTQVGNYLIKINKDF